MALLNKILKLVYKKNLPSFDFLLEKLIRLNIHPHFVSLVKPGHKNSSVSTIIMNNGITVSLLDAEQVPECTFLLYEMVSVLRIFGHGLDAFE